MSMVEQMHPLWKLSECKVVQIQGGVAFLRSKSRQMNAASSKPFEPVNAQGLFLGRDPS
jgi:hypothetical protein